MKSIFINRTYYGFGDWVMFGSVIKMINIQRPELDVYFNLINLPLWLVDLMACADIKAYAVLRNLEMERYDCYIRHLVYKPAVIHQLHFIESMVTELNRVSALGIKYDPEILMQYIGPEVKLDINRPYVVIPSMGSVNYVTSTPKEWGANGENFDNLAVELHKHGVATVQVGCIRDIRLKNVDKCLLGSGLPVYHSAIINSDAVVSLENGLSHYAGHHRKRTYTIYRQQNVRPCHANYPNQIPLTHELLTPEHLCDLIVKDIRTKEQKVYACI